MDNIFWMDNLSILLFHMGKNSDFKIIKLKMKKKTQNNRSKKKQFTDWAPVFTNEILTVIAI